ncbi:MAG: hypothetical protein HYU63_06780, partial [Armatimonadetes bacterium]|nr:hypothetical protein [Armatimonadota bacterium]
MKILKNFVLNLIILFFLIFKLFLSQVFSENLFLDDPNILVINEDNKEAIYSLKIYPKYTHILLLQISKEKLTKEFLEILNNYLKKGGVIWFNDPQLFIFWGEDIELIDPVKLKAKKGTFFYGVREDYPGIFCSASKASEHLILSGIKEVQVFILESSEKAYFSVKLNSELIPLLKVKDNKIVAAIKKVEDGYLILTPLLVKKSLKDALIFQENLKKFSLKKDLAVSSNTVLINLKSGIILKGNLINDNLVLETVERTHYLELNKLSKIQFQGASNLDLIFL